MREIPLLGALTDEQVQLLEKSSKENTYHKRETIFTPETRENYIMIVLKGRVRVYLAYPNGKEFTLAFLEPGDVYSSHSRTFTQSMEKSVIWIIDIAKFQLFLLNYPAIVISMVKVLGESLRSTLKIIENLVFLEVDKRLAAFLLESAKTKGCQTDRGIVVKLGLTVEELASAIGTSRQTASTLLNRWQKEGILKLGRKGFILTNFGALENLIE